MPNRLEILLKLDEQFKVVLNGHEAKYNQSLDDLRVNTDKLSNLEIKALRKLLLQKLKDDNDNYCL